MNEETPDPLKKTENTGFNRRKFLKTTALTVGAITIIPRYVLGKGYVSPSDKINLGFIGLGKQSRGLSAAFLKNTHAQIVAGSDVWTTKNKWFEQHIQSVYAAQRNQHSYTGIRTYKDYEELLNRQDIDAVVIVTPDHWHAIQSIEAMKAGKDVYCEKPLTLTIKEGMTMVKTARKTQKIVQTGSMQRSWDTFRNACELVRNGYMGQIKKVLVNVGDPARAYDLQSETTPAEVNWDRWCGPSPLLNYNHRLAPSNNDVKFWPDWRLYKEVGGGILADWGAHMFDIVQWALGMDRSGPVTFIPPEDPKAVRGLKMYYANGIEMVHEDFGRGWGVRFMGAEGTLDISRNYFETDPPNIRTATLKPADIRLHNTNGNHQLDWLKAIKNRSQPVCDVETGHRSATICNIGNIAYALRRSLTWDPERERFKGDAEANRMRGRKNRKFS
ncbi:MAG: Gfo/Idh/MocA family oxidoreductase [Bacteroidota bacterium]